VARVMGYVAALSLGFGLLVSSGRAEQPRVIPVATFGSDDRVPVPKKFAAVPDALGVMFNVKARSVCTAFCVADNIVGTAAHCLYRTTDERPPRLQDFWFARSYDAVRDYARIKGHTNGTAALNVISGSTKLSVQPPIDATSDWAFIRLAKPVCSKAKLAVEPLDPDAIEKAAKDNKIFQISYHRDFTQWQPAYSQPCPVSRAYEGVPWGSIKEDFSAPETLVLHTCDTGGASSGSPLLMETPNGITVVAINVGTYVQSKVLMRDGQVAQRLKADVVANTAVSANAFDGRLKAFRQSQAVAGAAQVKQIQERLKARQLYAGPVDGAFGERLKAAIEAYEQQAGLEPLGLPTDALLKRLTAQSAR
jgi:V8-like Glu-specific endopeptidase